MRRASPFTHDYLVGDQVALRERFGARGWLYATVNAVEPHRVTITVSEGKRKDERITVQLGRGGGRLRKVSLKELMEIEERRYPSVAPPAAAPDLTTLPMIRPVLIRPRAVPRPAPPARSPSYLAHVRLQPCCACPKPGPSDPHHTGPRGVGEKGSDFLAIPLCRACHEQVQKFYTLGNLSREATVHLITATQAQLLASWCAAVQAQTAERAAQLVLVPLFAGAAS